MLKFSNDRIKEGAADLIEMIVTGAARRITPILGSPIEVTMLEAIMAHQFCGTGKLPKVVVDGLDLPDWDGAWTVRPQAVIGNYRIDFLISDEASGVTAVVECDGHDFHERTKEQARHDRQRDRELQGKGYLVLRYTGSEIWRDPWGCVEDIEAKLWARMVE